jgi:hypothetical protein
VHPLTVRAGWHAACVSGVGFSMRYTVKWDGARKGYAIFDTVLDAWAADHPVFGLEHVASGIAESLNQQESARHHRRWLAGEDRARDKK